MGLPDEKGRAAIFRHYLEPLKIDATIDRELLAADLASLTPGLTGADIAHVCQQAVLLCVKDASRMEEPPEDLAISREHFQQAVGDISGGDTNHRNSSTPHDPEPTGSPALPEPASYLMQG